jgi:DNA (cytosine-5)-methyltransferase 1
LAPQGVPEEQLIRQQWHTRGRRQGDLPPVFVEHEYLSDQELLELQTFPGWWYLHGTRMERAFQIGNAVPPALAQAIGSAVINSELNHREGLGLESRTVQMREAALARP